jgi:hypothetical protein
MQQQTGNELYTELIKAYETLQKICTEITLIEDPTKRNQEFIAEEIFTRNKTLEIASTSPTLVIQGVSQKIVEIEAFFVKLANRNRELPIGKRSRTSETLD